MALFVLVGKCQCSIQHRIIVRGASEASYERPEHPSCFVLSCVYPSNTLASTTTTARLDVGARGG